MDLNLSIQLDARKFQYHGGARGLKHLRDKFLKDHFLLFPKFFPESLLAKICSRLNENSFHLTSLDGSGSEFSPDSNKIKTEFDLVFWHADFLEFVSAVTGKSMPTAMALRIYKMLPGTDNHISWHNDNFADRMLGLSLNLSNIPFLGGEFQIRHDDYPEIVHEVANTGFGDLLLFDIQHDINHRVQHVKGKVPKLSLAGWFIGDSRR